MTSIDQDAIRINHPQTVTAGAGRFYVEQRNCGYAENDGKWVVSLMPELYWSEAGCLRQRRPGAFIGVFDAVADVETAIASVELPGVADEMIMSMGRTSS